MRSVGERIRQARLAKGWSAEALSQRVGYKTQSGISNLENRAGGTGGARLPLIASELNVPLEWLLAGPDSDQVPFRTELPASPWTHGTITRATRHRVAEPSRDYAALQCPFDEGLIASIRDVLARLKSDERDAARAEMERALQLLVEH